MKSLLTFRNAVNLKYLKSNINVIDMLTTNDIGDTYQLYEFVCTEFDIPKQFAQPLLKYAFDMVELSYYDNLIQNSRTRMSRADSAQARRHDEEDIKRYTDVKNFLTSYTE